VPNFYCHLWFGAVLTNRTEEEKKTLCIAFLSLLLLLLIIWLLLIVIPYICFSLFCELNKCQLFFCWGSTFFYDNYFSRLVFCVVVLQFNCFFSFFLFLVFIDLNIKYFVREEEKFFFVSIKAEIIGFCSGFESCVCELT